jgi:hypothetical protein
MRNVVGALMKHGWAGLALAVAALLLALTAQPAAGAIPKVCRSSAVCKGACRQACNSLSVAKLAQLVVKYPAGWTDARLAAELFTPAATLAVTPIGAFEGALTALEYITTFSRASVRVCVLSGVARGGGAVFLCVCALFFFATVACGHRGRVAPPAMQRCTLRSQVTKRRR